MERRIFGIENEYGVTCTFDGQRRLTPDEVARYLFRKVVVVGPLAATSSSPTARGSTSTSAPTPSTPPPSATHVRQLVTHDKAGERILEGLVADAQQRLREEGIAGRDLRVQEQHRLGRQLLRLPRELPRRPGGRVPAALRRADPVPGQPADHLRRRQGRHDLQGRDATA